MFKELFSKEYKRYTIINIIAALGAIGVGTLFHFLFDISGENALVGLFTPVNESVWEHLKLLYFPFVISTVTEYYLYGKEAYNFFSSKAIGLSVGLVSIIANYYFIVGAFGINNMAVNIGIFVSAVFTAYAVSYLRMLKTPRLAGGIYEKIGIGIIGIYFILFAIFTYLPPHIPLFRDPTNMNYSV